MSKVSIVRVPEKPYDEEVFAAARQAVELLGGVRAFARAGDRVLIKPNWWCWPSTDPKEPAHMQYGTTDRRLVEVAARMFVELGCHVVIGEDPAVNRPIDRVYDGFRAAEVAQRSGAELVDLRAAGYRTIPVPRGREFTTLRVSNVALDADLVVSLPLMKSHALCGVTLTLKNMKGVIPAVEKRAFHQRNLSQGVADLATAVPPGLTIVDAILASDNWVAGGGIRPMGLVLAGDDPVATDAICCHVMQADPYTIDHLRWAAEAGAGEIDRARIQVLGPAIEEVSAPFVLPADPVKVAQELPNIQLLVGDACSGCLNRLGDVFLKIGKEQLAQAGEITFVVGKGVAPVAGRTNILVGVCTARYRSEGIYLADCPPMPADTIAAVKYASGETPELFYTWESIEMPPDPSSAG